MSWIPNKKRWLENSTPFVPSKKIEKHMMPSTNILMERALALLHFSASLQVLRTKQPWSVTTNRTIHHYGSLSPTPLKLRKCRTFVHAFLHVCDRKSCYGNEKCTSQRIPSPAPICIRVRELIFTEEALTKYAYNKRVAGWLYQRNADVSFCVRGSVKRKSSTLCVYLFVVAMCFKCMSKGIIF